MNNFCGDFSVIRVETDPTDPTGVYKQEDAILDLINYQETVRFDCCTSNQQ